LIFGHRGNFLFNDVKLLSTAGLGADQNQGSVIFTISSQEDNLLAK
jgi:hypothetical protein